MAALAAGRAGAAQRLASRPARRGPACPLLPSARPAPAPPSSPAPRSPHLPGSYPPAPQVGLLSFPPEDGQLHKPYSDDTARLIDGEVRSLVDAAYQRTLQVGDGWGRVVGWGRGRNAGVLAGLDVACQRTLRVGDGWGRVFVVGWGRGRNAGVLAGLDAACQRARRVG